MGSVAKNNSWVTLLLYKDARCDMNILDETVGADGWSREHYEVKDKDFCKIGINKRFAEPDEEPVWIYKSDCGSESYSEAEKGESSDAFKRAAVNWGIGRELYTAPFIFIPMERKLPNGEMFTQYELDKSGKIKASFRVSYIKIINKKIVGLNIENDKKRASVFSWGEL